MFRHFWVVPRYVVYWRAFLDYRRQRNAFAAVWLIALDASKACPIGFISPDELVNGLMANGWLFIPFHSSDHLSRTPVLFNKVHDLVILLLSNTLIAPRFTAPCPSALVGFESAVCSIVSTAITSNFARNRTLMSPSEFGDMGIAETLLFISSDCISLTLGELFISHSFSLLGGTKNRDYDGSPFYFLVLHLVYESKLHNKRLKRDCQRVAFPVPMSLSGYGCCV